MVTTIDGKVTRLTERRRTSTATSISRRTASSSPTRARSAPTWSSSRSSITAARAICSSGRWTAAAARSTSPRRGTSSRANAQWSPDGRYHLLHGGDRRRDAPVPRRRAGRRRESKVEQVTKGPRRLSGLTYRPGVHEDRLHGRRARRAGGRVRRRTSTAPARSRLTDVHRTLTQESRSSHTERLQWKSNDGTPIEGWLTLPHGYDRGARAVSADRVQPRRAARGHRLRLRLQEAVLRGERLLRARHELPQLDRLRRSVQVGDVGRVGRQGRRGRDVGHRLT